MRLFIKIDGREPGMIVGYGPGESGSPTAIVLCASSETPVAIELARCILPRVPKRLERKIRRFWKNETIDSRVALATESLN